MPYLTTLSKGLKQHQALFTISLWGVCLAILSSYAIVYAYHQGDSSSIGTATVAQFLLGSVFMLGAWLATQASISSRQITLLIIAGIALRVALIPVDSYTSSDTSRYLFDGKLAYEGIDPYQTAHDEPQLKALKQQWAPPEEHAKYVTLYPPIALALFSISASAGVDAAPLAWKVIVTIFSILTLLISTLILRQLNRLQHLPLVALSPLLILESGVGAHLDSVSAAIIAAVIWAWIQQRNVLTGILIAIGTAVKLLPLALLMPIGLYALFNGKIKRGFIIGLTALAALIVIYGVTFYIGFKPIGSIGVFFQKWRFGSPIFTLLEQGLTDKTLLITLASIFVSALLILTARLFIQRDKGVEHVIHTSQYVLALPLVLSPVLFPWYLMPLMVLTALRPNMLVLSWIILAPLTYEVLDQFLCCRVWHPSNWPLWTMLGGVIAVLTIKTLIFFFQVRTQRAITGQSNTK